MAKNYGKKPAAAPKEQIVLGQPGSDRCACADHRGCDRVDPAGPGDGRRHPRPAEQPAGRVSPSIARSWTSARSRWTRP